MWKLSKSAKKSVCTVLDFVGTHRSEFRFDRRLSGLLGGTRKYVQEQVEKSFPFLPAGCHMELDVVARQIILESLKSALPSRWKEKVAELQNMVKNGIVPSLENYLLETGLDLSDVYTAKKSWSDFLAAVKASEHAAGPHEAIMRRAIGRLLHIDDEERLDFYIQILDFAVSPDMDSFTARERRMVRMLVAATCDQVLDKEDSLAYGLAIEDGFIG